MNHIFLSHSAEDAEIAERFYNDLRNAGHEARIDKFKLGENTIKFMNEGIAGARSIVILFSKHTPAAVWQNCEINGAFWNEIQQGGGTCCVIRLDETLLPPLLGPKVFAKLLPDASNYKEVLGELCAAVLPSKTACSIVADAFQAKSHNPFRRVRAEFFEDVPRLLAESFAPPDAIKMSVLEEMKPCFLEGPRGTGKSMLLLALRARNLASRTNGKPIAELFGFYIKLSRGAVCSAGILSNQTVGLSPVPDSDLIQITDAFTQEIVLCLLESLFSEIKFSIQERNLDCDARCERALADSVYEVLMGNKPDQHMTIEDILSHMTRIHLELANFIRRKFIYREAISVPIAVLGLETLKNILRLAKETVPALRNTMFVVLLDEYENLYPFQQKVINGFVKLAAPDFTVKIAKKLGGDDVSGTTMGQELQEIHDYNRVVLVYDVEDNSQLKLYGGLLATITEKLLRGMGHAYENMQALLPISEGTEVDRDAWLAEVAQLSKIPLANLNRLQASSEWSEKVNYYSQAAIYRVLYRRGGRQAYKSYSGFDNLTVLSSGVIRYFLEMLGVAFHLQYADSVSVPKPPSIAPGVQTRAVHIVSQHYLTTLSRNVEDYGEQLKYFVLDIGDCLRHKLLHHASEPEAGRLTIADPQMLDDPRFAEIRRALALGIREGVFQTKEGRPAFKPKHRSDPQPAEVSICRVYAPVLQISPRQRWRTNVSCEELLALWTPETRATAKKSLMKKMVKLPQTQPGLYSDNGGK